MPLTFEQLLEIASQYFDTTVDSYLRQENSPQFERCVALWKRELRKIDSWHAFLDALDKDVPDFHFGDGTAPMSPCFRCVAYPGKTYPNPTVRWAVVGCVSILAPVYAIHGVAFEREGTVRKSSTTLFEPLPVHMRGIADLIARRLEAEYHVTALPRELADRPVPLYIESKRPPETTLFHALFTDRPEIIP